MVDHEEAALDAALRAATRPVAGDAFERRLLADYDALGLKRAAERRRWFSPGLFAPAGALAGLCAAGYLAGAASVGSVAAIAPSAERYAYIEDALNAALPAAATEEDVW